VQITYSAGRVTAAVRFLHGDGPIKSAAKLDQPVAQDVAAAIIASRAHGDSGAACTKWTTEIPSRTGLKKTAQPIIARRRLDGNGPRIGKIRQLAENDAVAQDIHVYAQKVEIG